MLNIVHLY